MFWTLPTQNNNPNVLEHIYKNKQITRTINNGTNFPDVDCGNSNMCAKRARGTTAGAVLLRPAAACGQW